MPPDGAAAATGDTRLVEVAGADHSDRALLDATQLIAATIDLADRCAPPR